MPCPTDDMYDHIDSLAAEHERTADPVMCTLPIPRKLYEELKARSQVLTLAMSDVAVRALESGMEQSNPLSLESQLRERVTDPEWREKWAPWATRDEGPEHEYKTERVTDRLCDLASAIAGEEVEGWRYVNMVSRDLALFKRRKGFGDVTG